MVTKKQLEKKYGKKKAGAILKTPTFAGATCRVLKNGELDFYDCDIEQAIEYLKTGKEGVWD